MVYQRAMALTFLFGTAASQLPVVCFRGMLRAPGRHPPRRVAAVLLAGACFYGLLIGRIEPQTDPAARNTMPAAAGVRPAE